MKAELKQKNPNWLKDLQKRVSKIDKIEAACGFPKGKSETAQKHEDSDASILDIAIYNQYGTFQAPARDFMTPAENEIKSKWDKMSKESIPAINSGKLNAETILEAGANMAQAEIKKSIVELKTPPNAPTTIEGGWVRNKKSGKMVKVKGKGSDNPLIDTGQMMNAVTYAIRKK